MSSATVCCHVRKCVSAEVAVLGEMAEDAVNPAALTCWKLLRIGLYNGLLNGLLAAA
jgi:hypothetical protein